MDTAMAKYGGVGEVGVVVVAEQTYPSSSAVYHHHDHDQMYMTYAAHGRSTNDDGNSDANDDDDDDDTVLMGSTSGSMYHEDEWNRDNMDDDCSTMQKKPPAAGEPSSHHHPYHETTMTNSRRVVGVGGGGGQQTYKRSTVVPSAATRTASVGGARTGNKRIFGSSSPHVSSSTSAGRGGSGRTSPNQLLLGSLGINSPLDSDSSINSRSRSNSVNMTRGRRILSSSHSGAPAISLANTPAPPRRTESFSIHRRTSERQLSSLHGSQSKDENESETEQQTSDSKKPTTSAHMTSGRRRARASSSSPRRSRRGSGGGTNNGSSMMTRDLSNLYLCPSKEESTERDHHSRRSHRDSNENKRIPLSASRDEGGNNNSSSNREQTALKRDAASDREQRNRENNDDCTKGDSGYRQRSSSSSLNVNLTSHEESSTTRSIAGTSAASGVWTMSSETTAPTCNHAVHGRSVASTGARGMATTTAETATTTTNSAAALKAETYRNLLDHNRNTSTSSSSHLPLLGNLESLLGEKGPTSKENAGAGTAGGSVHEGGVGVAEAGPPRQRSASRNFARPSGNSAAGMPSPPTGTLLPPPPRVMEPTSSVVLQHPRPSLGERSMSMPSMAAAAAAAAKRQSMPKQQKHQQQRQLYPSNSTFFSSKKNVLRPNDCETATSTTSPSSQSQQDEGHHLSLRSRGLNGGHSASLSSLPLENEQEHQGSLQSPPPPRKASENSTIGRILQMTAQQPPSAPTVEGSSNAASFTSSTSSSRPVHPQQHCGHNQQTCPQGRAQAQATSSNAVGGKRDFYASHSHRSIVSAAAAAPRGKPALFGSSNSPTSPTTHRSSIHNLTAKTPTSTARRSAGVLGLPTYPPSSSSSSQLPPPPLRSPSTPQLVVADQMSLIPTTTAVAKTSTTTTNDDDADAALEATRDEMEGSVSSNRGTTPIPLAAPPTTVGPSAPAGPQRVHAQPAQQQQQQRPHRLSFLQHSQQQRSLLQLPLHHNQQQQRQALERDSGEGTAPAGDNTAPNNNNTNTNTSRDSRRGSRRRSSSITLALDNLRQQVQGGGNNNNNNNASSTQSNNNNTQDQNQNPRRRSWFDRGNNNKGSNANSNNNNQHNNADDILSSSLVLQNHQMGARSVRGRQSPANVALGRSRSSSHGLGLLDHDIHDHPRMKNHSSNSSSPTGPQDLHSSMGALDHSARSSVLDYRSSGGGGGNQNGGLLDRSGGGLRSRSRVERSKTPTRDLLSPGGGLGGLFHRSFHLGGNNGDRDRNGSSLHHSFSALDRSSGGTVDRSGGGGGLDRSFVGLRKGGGSSLDRSYSGVGRRGSGGSTSALDRSLGSTVDRSLGRGGGVGLDRRGSGGFRRGSGGSHAGGVAEAMAAATAATSALEANTRGFPLNLSPSPDPSPQGRVDLQINNTENGGKEGTTISFGGSTRAMSSSLASLPTVSPPPLAASPYGNTDNSDGVARWNSRVPHVAQSGGAGSGSSAMIRRSSGTSAPPSSIDACPRPSSKNPAARGDSHSDAAAATIGGGREHFPKLVVQSDSREMPFAMATTEDFLRKILEKSAEGSEHQTATTPAIPPLSTYSSLQSPKSDPPVTPFLPQPNHTNSSPTGFSMNKVVEEDEGEDVAEAKPPLGGQLDSIAHHRHHHQNHTPENALASSCSPYLQQDQHHHHNASVARSSTKRTEHASIIEEEYEDDDERGRPSQHDRRSPQSLHSPRGGRGALPPQRPQLEIAPGMYKELRGSVETWNAVRSKTSRLVTCLACTEELQCVADAELVICPTCRSLTPLSPQQTLQRQRYHPRRRRHRRGARRTWGGSSRTEDETDNEEDDDDYDDIDDDDYENVDQQQCVGGVGLGIRMEDVPVILKEAEEERGFSEANLAYR